MYSYKSNKTRKIFAVEYFSANVAAKIPEIGNFALYFSRSRTFLLASHALVKSRST